MISRSGCRARRSASLRDARSASSEQIVTGLLESDSPMQRNCSRKLCGKVVPALLPAVQLSCPTNIILRSNVASLSSNGLIACASTPHGQSCSMWRPGCIPMGRLSLGSDCCSAGVGGNRDTLGSLIGTLICTGPGSGASAARSASLIRRLQYLRSSTVCGSGSCTALRTSEPKSPG